MHQIQPSNLDFLRLLKKHNNRDWFNQHKDQYLEEYANLEKFGEAVFHEMSKHDVVESAGNRIMHRIYRDIRFSSDKTPYKTNWGGSFGRATKARRGSYYFHLEPGKSYAAGGFWGPNPADLKRIRDEFSHDPGPMRKILKQKNVKETFGTLSGEQIKTTPKGFDANDPAIDLLRYKQFELIKHFTDKEVLAPGFLKHLNDTFRKMRPFLDYMTDVLTTDVNGVSVL